MYESLTGGDTYKTASQLNITENSRYFGIFIVDIKHQYALCIWKTLKSSAFVVTLTQKGI